MPRLFVFSILAGVFLFACQPGTPAAMPTPTLIPGTATLSHDEIESDGTVEFSRHGVNVRFPHPRGWESFMTDYGVVIAEKFGSVADHGQLKGLMVYVFVTPFVEFPFEVSNLPGANHAQQVLSAITADTAASGAAQVTHAQGFTWAGYDAAYYLHSEPETGIRTLVIGLSMPETGVLLTCALSAPRHAAERIRPMLAQILDGLILNAKTIGASDLDALPETLDFPD